MLKSEVDFAQNSKPIEGVSSISGQLINNASTSISAFANQDFGPKVEYTPEYFRQQDMKRQGMGGMNMGSYGGSEMPDMSGDYSPDGYYNKIAGIESGGKWNAVNRGSGAYGKFQFIPSTEKAYASKLGLSIPEARTPAGQMKMVSAFTNDNIKGLENAGVPITNRNLYLAHQQGLGGAINLIKGNHSAVSNRNIQSNLPGGGSKQDYMNYWTAKFS